MAETDVQELADLFREAGRAHHEAFVDAGGADPEWPLWYAEHLLDKLNAHLGARMSKSELVYLLVSADCEQKTLAPGGDWHAYFARFFAERYA